LSVKGERSVDILTILHASIFYTSSNIRFLRMWVIVRVSQQTGFPGIISMLLLRNNVNPLELLRFRCCNTGSPHVTSFRLAP